jgi:membrane associated rhomboid family serine protease
MPPLPPATLAIVLSCVAGFCLATFVPTLYLWFGLWPVGSGNFMPWQLLTHALLHSGVSHLVFNLLAVWLFGAELERVWGQRRFWQFTVAGVLAAAVVYLLLSLLIGSRNYAVGISGVFFALLLAYATVFARRQFDAVGFIPVVLLMIPSLIVNVVGIMLFVLMFTNRSALPIPPMPVPAKAMVLAFGAIQLLIGVVGGGGIVALSHLGGMLGGWLMLRYWRGAAPFGSRRR